MMTKKRKLSESIENAYADPKLLPILPSERLEPGKFEAQAWVDDTFYRKLDELRGEWRILVEKIGSVVSGTEKISESILLDEVSVQIGFNAKGKLVFVAEAGVNASFTLRMKIQK
jgi:hypothetical protein